MEKKHRRGIMMKKVKFIHGADLHLDSPMIGLKHLPNHLFKRLQEATFQSFTNLIGAAIANQVDFVILAGDLFDHEDRSVRAQARLYKEMERLHQAQIDVFIIHGNHDHLGGRWTQLKLPDNVHIFGEQVEVKRFVTTAHTSVHLYGFSYPERHVTERKITDYHLTAEADFHIGILHGNLEGNVDHGNYAPFQLKELIRKNFHYWALGHIHKRAILSESPPIVYPGNIQGRHKKEEGAKGCYLVTLTEAEAQLDFIETNDIVWTELIMDGTKILHFDELYHGTKEQLARARLEGKGVLVHLKIINLTLDQNDLNAQAVDELLDVLQDEEKDEASFVWPITIAIEEQIESRREDLVNDSDFFHELFDVIDQFSAYEQSLAPLYEHPRARKFLTPLSANEVAELKKEAETLLIQKLLHK